MLLGSELNNQLYVCIFTFKDNKSHLITIKNQNFANPCNVQGIIQIHVDIKKGKLN